MNETIYKEAMCGIFFLMSALDAMVILDASADDLTQNTSFSSTSFKDPDQMRIQEDIKSLESFQTESNTLSANLNTVNNLFKHYMPSPRWSKSFTVTNINGRKIIIQDMFIAFGEESGPILYDLVIPAYNKACDLLVLLGKARRVDVEVRMIDGI